MTSSPATQMGYVLIGVYINLALFGVTLVQAWLYYTRYRKDPLVLKLTVATLLSLDVINSVGDSVAIYDWLVRWYGDSSRLNRVTASFIAAVQAGALAATIVQCFLAWRVQRLRRQWWLTLITAALSLIGLLGSIGTMVGLSIIKYPSRWIEIQPITLIWASCSVACDVIITTILYLTLRRDVNTFGNKDSQMVRIKNLILQTSALTLVIDLAHLITVAMRPGSLLHVLFAVIMPKLYINSLLSTLNTRRSGSELMAQGSSTAQLNPDVKPRSKLLKKSLWGNWAPTTATTSPLPDTNQARLRASYPQPGQVHISTVQTVQDTEVQLDPGMLSHPLAPKRSSTDDLHSHSHSPSARSASIHSARIVSEVSPSTTGVTFASEVERMA